MTNEERANQICREVAELPDRSSPEYAPEMMLVSHAELFAIVTGCMEEAALSPSGDVKKLAREIAERWAFRDYEQEQITEDILQFAATVQAAERERCLEPISKARESWARVANDTAHDISGDTRQLAKDRMYELDAIAQAIAEDSDG